MPQYKYKAVDRAGKVTDNLVIEADSREESVSRIRQKGFTPIKFIGEVGGADEAQGGFLLTRKSLDPCEFTNRLVPLLNAQIPIERALSIIEEGMEDDRGKSMVNEIRRGLHEGKKFSSLIRARGAVFPGIYANMVEAGEESGALVGVMQELQRFLNDRKELREFLITSSIYPSIIMTVTMVVIILLFTLFVPRFSKIFLDMGKTLPLPTQIMLGISNLLTGYWWLWIILIILGAATIRQIQRGGKFKAYWDEYILKVPVFGKLIHLIEISRFVRTLAVLIRNHVHLLETVRIAERVIQNSQILATLAGTAGELKGGARLSKALSKSDYIPQPVVRMLSIGEETGNMGEMLEKVAEQYEENVRNQIKRMLSMFEPVVILFLAFVVLGVVLAMFLAILEMNQI